MKSKTKTIIPFIIFLVLTLITNFLVNLATDAESLQDFKVYPCISKHFQYSMVALSLAATTILFLLSRRYTVQQIGKLLFGFATVMLFILFFISLPMHDCMLVTEGAAAKETTFMHFYRNLDVIFLYGLLSLWPSAMILIFYGYANENYTFKEAVKYYPIFGLIALAITQFVLPLVKFLDIEYTTTTFGIAFIFCALGSIGCLYWIDDFNYHKREEKSFENRSRLSKKYILNLGILVGFSAIIIKLAQTVWRYGVVEMFPTPAEYSHYFADFTLYSGIAVLMTLSVFLFMSLCIQHRLAKAWKNIYYAIACVSLILGGAFFCSVIFKISLTEMLSKSNTLIPLDALNTVGASYQILVSSVIYPIVLCLKELALVVIPAENRFTAKLSVDLIFTKMTLFLTSLGLTTLFTSVGATASVFPIIAIIFFIAALARFVFIHKIGKDLVRMTNEENITIHRGVDG
jgi:ATP/ADP translocase